MHFVIVSKCKQCSKVQTYSSFVGTKIHGYGVYGTLILANIWQVRRTFLSSEFGTFAYFTPIDNIQMVFGVCQARKG